MLRSRKFWGFVGILVLLWALANPIQAANAVNGLIDGGDGVGDSVSTFVENVDTNTGG